MTAQEAGPLPQPRSRPPLGARLRRFSYAPLVGPAALAMIGFLVIPLIYMLRVSFYHHVSGAYMLPAFTAENYLSFLGDTFYLSKVLWVTFKLSILSSLLAVIMAYPLAYYLARHAARMQRMLLVLVLSPLWIGVLIRLFGWMIILMDTGVINRTLMSLGLIQEPLKLMYSETGVLIALTQISVPYVVLTLVGVIQGIHPSLEEAAQNMGANKLQTIWRVTLPLSMPGVAAGSLLIFALNASSFVIPNFMGGGRVRMMALMAYNQAMQLGNLPMAAAVGFILMVVSALAVVLYMSSLNRVSGREVV